MRTPHGSLSKRYTYSHTRLSLTLFACAPRRTLDNNKLQGSIPLALLNITGLTYLGLSTNQLTGEIPADVLTRFPGLTTLRLGDNDLRGCVPENLHLACKEAALDCRSGNATTYLPTEGSSAADQACGPLPVCGEEAEGDVDAASDCGLD